MENSKRLGFKAILALILFAGTIMLTGCSKQEKTLGGALIGAGAGAGIGAAAGGGGGAAIGAGVGAITGGLIGHSMGDDEK